MKKDYSIIFTHLSQKTRHINATFFVATSIFMTACASYNAPVLDASTTVTVEEPLDSTRPLSQEQDSQGQPQQNEVVSGEELQGQPLLSDDSVEAQALPSERSSPPVVAQLLRQSEEASAQQDWQKAESYLQRALRISPKNALLWSRMAEAKLRQGKNSQAIQFASKSNAISNDPNLKLQNEAIIEAAGR